MNNNADIDSKDINDESLAIASSALYQKYMHFDFHLMADFNEAHVKHSRTKKLYLSEDGAYFQTDCDGNVKRKDFLPKAAISNLNKRLSEPSFQKEEDLVNLRLL